MPNPSARTFGFELEYASGARAMLPLVYNQGLCRMTEFHRYHCDCEQCIVRNPYSDGPPAPDLHAQTDSTADGEFISRILDDFDDLQRIAAGMTECATQANATTGPRCGLHVHVGLNYSPSSTRYDHTANQLIATTYLAYERYFTEIVAPGRSQQKRDMNTTLMQALRAYVTDGYASGDPEYWKQVGRLSIGQTLSEVISRDRHVDLNYSRYGTVEFRVFNATNSPWRIELACRMAVAFVEATPGLSALVEASVRGSTSWPVGCDSPWGEIVRPAWSALPAPHPTKRPTVSMDAFIDALADVDPLVRPLIERQRSYMRARYARQVS